MFLERTAILFAVVLPTIPLHTEAEIYLLANLFYYTIKDGLFLIYADLLFGENFFRF